MVEPPTPSASSHAASHLRLASPRTGNKMRLSPPETPLKTLKRLVRTPQPLSPSPALSPLRFLKNAKRSSAISIVLVRSAAAALAKRHFSRRLNSVWRGCHLTFPLCRDPHPSRLYNLSLLRVTCFLGFMRACMHLHRHRQTAVPSVCPSGFL